MATPAPTPSGSTGKFAGGFTAGTTARKAPAKAAKPKTTPIQDLIGGTVSAGQAALNTLMTPMYFVEDAVWRTIHNSNDPKVQAKVAKLQQTDPAGYFNWLGGQIAETGKAATAWQRGQEVKHTGGAIAKQLGLISNENTPLAKTGNVVAGLAFDVLLDPTTYIPGGVIAKVLKGASKTAEYGAKGLVEGAKGMVPVSRAIKQGVTPEMAVAKELPVKEVSVKGARLKERNLVGAEAPAGIKGKQRAYNVALQGTKTNLIQIPNAVDRAVSQKVSDAVATSLTMGYNALRGTLLSHDANKFLSKYAEQTAKIARKTPKTAVATAEKIIEDTAPAEAKVAETAIPTPAQAAKGFAPVVDKVTNFEKAQYSLGKADYKFLSKKQAELEKIAKSAEGTAASGPKIAQAVESVIMKRRGVGDHYFAAMPANRQAIVRAEYKNIPFQIIDQERRVQDNAARKMFGKTLYTRVINTTKGRKAIGQIIESGVPFNKLPIEDRMAIMRQFELAIDGSNATKIAEKQLASIVKDSADLNALLKEGAAGSTQFNMDAVKSIIDRIAEKQSTEVKKYTGVDEMLAGLKAGDTISNDVLFKFIKTLDPDAPLIKDIETQARQLTDINLGAYLTGKYEETLAQMKQRVFLSDPKRFVQQSGIGQADAVYAHFDAVTNGTYVPVAAIEKETAQAAAEKVAKFTPSEMKFTTEIIREALGQRFKEAAKILEAEGSIYRESSLKDMAAIFNKENLTEGAILPNAINQSAQSIIFHKVAGGATELIGNQLKRMSVEKFATFNEAANRMSRVASTMRDIDAVFKAVFKTSMFIQRYAEKGTKNLENKHLVYLHMGDIIETFTATPEGTRILQKALFPVGKDYTKYDALDGVSVLNATRRILEQREKQGMGVDLNEVMAIARKKDSTDKLSKTFKNEIDQVTADFVEHLHKVSPELEAIHLNRAKAITKDIANESMGVASEVMDLYKEGLALAAKTGLMSTEHGFNQLKDIFNRFSFVTGAMQQRSGNTAAAIANATAMLFIRNGRFTTKSGTLLDQAFTLLPEAETQAAKEFNEALNTFARHEDPRLTPPAGREHILPPEEGAQDKVAIKYAAAKQVMDDLRVEGESLTSKTALAGWKRRVATAVRKMDEVRQEAWNHWLPVEHWSNVQNAWIPSEQFDHAAELLWAKNHPPILVDEKAVNLGLDMVDTAVKVQRKATAAEKAAAKKATEKAIKAKDVVTNKVVATDVADALLAANKLAAPAEDNGLAALADLNEYYLRRMEADRLSTYVYPLTLKPMAKEVQGVDRLSLAQRIGGRISINSGMADLAPVLQSLEANLRKFESDMAHAIDKILSAYPEQVKDLAVFGEFYHRAVNNLPLEGGTEVELKFQQQLTEIMQNILADAEYHGIAENSLKNAFSHYRIGQSAEGSMKNVLDNLIINKNTYAEGTEEFIKHELEQKAFAEEGGSAASTLFKVASSIQYVKMYRNMASTLVNDFGWKAWGFKDAAAARKAGFVEIKAAGDSQLMNAMVGPEEGALFHPEIASQIGALDRAQNKIFNSDRMPKIALALMTMTSYIKFTQTSINPRHHITNMAGDTTAEMIAGTVNPAHWLMAQRVAAEFFKGLTAAEYGKAMLDPSLSRAFTHLGSPEEIAQGLKQMTKHGADNISIVIGGKEKPMTLTQFADILAKANILTGSMMNDEILAMYEHLIADSVSSGSIRDLKKSIQAKAKLGIEKGMKPFGDFSAAYSNIPRAAGAIRIAMSRNWRNEQDMINAMSKHVHTYHPTISSLAPAERRYGRLLIGYYTWLRGAHTALADMIVNHTAATIAVPKLLSNIRQQNDIQQVSPGTPWAPNAPVPQNMKGSVYGPLYMGGTGPTGIQTSTLPLDVLNNWQMYYDPMLNTDQLAGANLQVLGRFFGGSANPAARQILQEMLGMDFQTGKTYTDRSGSAAIDRFIQTLGPSQLAQGLGWYTPQGKTVTPEQRQQKLRKYVFGTKEFDQNAPGVQKAANLENSARIKAWIASQGQK